MSYVPKPVVREFGSLGCSGDLAALAQRALVLMGEGEAVDANGTDGMLGMLIFAIVDLSMLYDSLDVVAAMSVDALLCADAVFTPDMYGPLRPHPEQAISAARMLWRRAVRERRSHPKVIGLGLMGSD